MQYVFSNMCFFSFSQRYSTQFTAESRVVFKMHDLLKKHLFKIQQSFRGVHFSSFNCTFMRKVYWFPASVLRFFNKATLFKAKYRWCLEKVYIDSIVVKPSLEEVHVQSGHVIFWKALVKSVKGYRTLFRKCRLCSWKLHSCRSISSTYLSRNINYCKKNNKCVK